ncbi:hypothetical protein C2R22_17330 [Salinigranum rubrum]|uniref:Uncharacterized protein n=1 Tax=Salinigranum rubrum TaxID=755307 RepID=A0A2I8VMP1_9EURY|nr:hypothetical protein [Salinigranum rubrum]AUV83188.1 hypothetical protein C2R22_17330 [Salinigranum rubrum]
MSTRPTLAALLRTRSRRDVAAFVAALYDARGSTTRVDAGGVVVDGDRYLVVESGHVARLRARVRPRSPSPDVVVAVDPSRADALAGRYGVPVWTPADLDRLARYGLDRTVADRLFHEHLDCAVGDVAPTAHAAAGAPSTPTPRASDGRPRGTGESGLRLPESAVLAALVVAALVAFGAVASPVGGPGISTLAGGGDVESDATGAGAAPDEAGVADEPRPTPDTSTPTPDARRLAPGLAIDGVVDSEALGEAHARAMANRSYTWELTYIEYANDDESGRATELVTVERPTVYASRVTTDGFLSSRGPVAFRSSYADGERLYRPATDGIDSSSIEQRGPVGLQEERASQYYALLLDGEETSVVRTILGDPRLYVVDIRGTSASTVRNYTATAHVAPDGTVVYYAGSYCYVAFRGDETRETCLRLTMQYRNVGGTTVEPPAWYVGEASVGTPTERPSSGNASTPGTETPTATQTRTRTGVPTATEQFDGTGSGKNATAPPTEATATGV